MCRLNTPKVLGRGCGVLLLLLRGWGRAGRQAALAGKAGCAYGLRWRIARLRVTRLRVAWLRVATG